jgi:hypothetical protein
MVGDLDSVSVSWATPGSVEGPFVVLQLGSDDVTLHVWDPETLTALAGMVT